MDRNQEIMDHSKEEMIKHLELAVKEFKDFDRLLWLNNHICRPPYDDDIKGFLNRAKERIYSATRADFESAYDECIKSGIEVPNGCDVLKIIGNKAATPEDKEILTDVFYEWCRGLVMEQCTKKLVVGYAARVVFDLNQVTQGLILNGVVCLPKYREYAIKDCFLARAKDMIMEASWDQLEAAYDECAKEGIGRVRDYYDSKETIGKILRIIGNKAHNPNNEKLIESVWFGFV